MISKIHQLSQRIFSKMLKDNNLDLFNPSQGRIIFVLLKKDNIPIHDLVEKTQLSKSTLSSHLDNLEKLGFVEKNPSNEDKREVYIVLTNKAYQMKQKYVQVSREMINLFYQDFTQSEIDLFENYLQKCLQNLISYKH